MTSATIQSRATAGEPPVRLWPIVDVEAPAERLAMLRLLTGAFAVAYLAIRLPVYVELTERQRGFDGVGLAALLRAPVPDAVILGLIAVTLGSGLAATAGWCHRLTGPMFAVGFLALASYRGSWGQLLHFENLVVLHLLILALSPAADAWALDARRRTRAGHERTRRARVDYGWPIALAGLVVVVTYVITGFAKLRYGGLDWIIGDTLRNHVAYAAARLDLLGGRPSPLAGWVVDLHGVWPIVAAFTVVVELAAPVALFGGRLRTAWVAAAWSLHAGILAVMLIGFPYPLFLVAFAPFFRVERLWTDRPARLGRGGVRRSPVAS